MPEKVPRMKVDHINPPKLSQPNGYTHVVAVEGGVRLIFVSGQLALNERGQIVGSGDLRGQIRQVIINLRAALAAAGAKPEHVVKLNTYIVNYKPSDLAVLREVRAEFRRQTAPPASTLIGVGSLAVEEAMVEIEAIAAVPAK
jgi:enamine deaminase RidA (YjgF/YER057c/UK114 family)